MNNLKTPIIGLLLTVAPLMGQVFSDSFETGANPGSGEYTAGSGNLVGQSPTVAGWTGSWNAGVNDANVMASGLSYAGLVTSGGAIQTSGNTRVGRDLATPINSGTSGALYMSVLLQVEDNINNYRSLELHNGGLADGNRTMQIAVGEGNSNFNLRINNDNSLLANLGAGDNSVNLFVMKFDLSTTAGADAVSIWRNPEDLSSEALSTMDGSLSGFDMAFNITSLARFNSGGGIIMDELRFGQSWSDVVVAVPEPSVYAGIFGALALALVYVRRRR